MSYVNADERAAETGGKLLYGMNKDLADKAAKKWVEQGGDKMDADARAWIEALTGTKLEGTTQEALKSGNILCELVNVIKPGSCPAPSKMSAPFKQMENIGNYLKACEGLGLRDAETFQTVSLYEDQDMLQVLVQIHSLGRIAQAIGFEGPTLGPKISEENKREFTAAQLAASAGQATKLGMGSSTAPAAGMKTAELLGSNIVKVGNTAAGGGGGPAPTPPPPAPPAQAPTPGDGAGRSGQPNAAGGMPSSAKSAYADVNAATTDANGRLLYGMDKELADKAAAKFDPKMDADARAWIEAVTGLTLEGSTHEALKSGIVLCALANAIKPGCCKAPSKMSAPFKQMENIGNYLEACTSLGMGANDSFQTVALYENQDMMAVLIQITSLGRIAQKIGFQGPTLGVKLAAENVREFTAEQLAEAKNATTFMGKGSHGTAGGNMSKVGGGKKYAHMADIEGVEGLGLGGGVDELGLVGKGAKGTAGGDMTKADAGRQIDAMSKVSGADGMGTGGETTMLGVGSHGTAGGDMSKVETGRDINKMKDVQ